MTMLLFQIEGRLVLVRELCMCSCGTIPLNQKSQNQPKVAFLSLETVRNVLSLVGCCIHDKISCYTTVCDSAHSLICTVIILLSECNIEATLNYNVLTSISFFCLVCKFSIYYTSLFNDLPFFFYCLSCLTSFRNKSYFVKAICRLLIYCAINITQLCRTATNCKFKKHWYPFRIIHQVQNYVSV